MGRGRVQMKRIENKISRQVTFSKRRSGLIKKANEISVLCDADVALIVFSTNGKLFEFSTDSSMNQILERYEQYTVKERRITITNSEPKINPTLEHPKLQMKLELLQRNLRNCLGEGLEQLSLRELQSLELQLDSSLKRIRTKKNQLMHESISQIQKKERVLQEENKLLVKKIKESKKGQSQGDEWKQQYIAYNPPIFMLPPEQPSRLLTLPSLTIGGPFETMESTNEEDKEAHTRPTSANSQIPPWMLRHVNNQLQN